MKGDIRIFVGFDHREAVSYHAFCHSVIEKAKEPHRLCFTPLWGEQRDGSNQFIYARFKVPEIMGWGGRALFLDGDMTCLGDIGELWDLFDPKYAVQVVKHDYHTKFPTKYWGQVNDDYPRKNWSSVMLWNCGHMAHFRARDSLTSEEGSYLHRFQWLKDEEIGELPKAWNWLAKEYPYNPDAKLVHHTIGLPIDPAGEGDPWAEKWNEAFLAAVRYRL